MQEGSRSLHIDPNGEHTRDAQARESERRQPTQRRETSSEGIEERESLGLSRLELPERVIQDSDMEQAPS